MDDSVTIYLCVKRTRARYHYHSPCSYIHLAGSRSYAIKLDNIKPLKGHENYETWSCQVSLVLFPLGAKPLIITGEKPDDMTTDKADSLMQQALLIIIQLVSEPILAQIASHTTAHEMWVYL